MDLGEIQKKLRKKISQKSQKKVKISSSKKGKNCSQGTSSRKKEKPLKTKVIKPAVEDKKEVFRDSLQ